MEQSVRLPASGAVTGWAACRLHGGNFFDGLASDGTTEMPVPLSVGPHGNVRADRLVTLSFHSLPPEEVTTRHGIAVVKVTRAAYDAMRLASDPRETVVVVDMMQAAELVSARTIRDHAARSARPDPTVSWALDLASEHSRSPNETRLRLIWVIDAGLRTPLVNCPVYDLSGRLLGIADLFDDEAGVVVEFDGADHRRARRQSKDVQKTERLRRVGLEVTRVTGQELQERSMLVDRFLASRARAAFAAPADRLWVARPPADDLHARIIEREQLRQLHEALEAQPLPDIRELRGY
jgi:hypothetical protein